jgi:hypothetical protein
LEVLKTSGSGISLNISIGSLNGKLDDYEAARELLTQYGIMFQDTLE